MFFSLIIITFFVLVFDLNLYVNLEVLLLIKSVQDNVQTQNEYTHTHKQTKKVLK